MFLGVLSALLSRRLWLLTLLNAVFFCGMFAAALATRGPYLSNEEQGVTGEIGITFLSIFVSNLVVSGYLLLTVPGLLLFAVPVGVLAWRAAMWGVLLNGLSTPALLAALPTILLEGEGYVFAGAAGVILGLSWLRPRWVGLEDVSRRESLRRAMKECAHLYVLVALLLLAAAAAETLTLFMSQ
jgi:hypothetical protein